MHPCHSKHLSKLNRVAGQVEAIKKMINENRYCVDIMTQIKAARSASDNKAPPAAVGKQMVAAPYGFFCLNQTWQTMDRNDYSLIPLLDDTVTIGTGKVLPDEFSEAPETATNKDYR